MHPTIRIFGIVGCRIVGIQNARTGAGLPFLKSLNKKGFSKTNNPKEFQKIRLNSGSIVPTLAH
jgi:hypothetical protein